MPASPAHSRPSRPGGLSRRATLTLGGAATLAGVSLVRGAPAGAQAVGDLDDLDDVDVAGAGAGDLLGFDGTDWIADPLRDQLTLNVRDFGATGDGTTNDTSAVGAAIDAALAVSAAVFFPRGVYSVPSLAKTVGLGASLSLIAHGDAQLKGNGTGPVIRVEGTVRVDGLTFTQTGTAVGIADEAVEAVIDITHCRFVDCGSPLRGASDPDASIASLRFSDNEVVGCDSGVHLWNPFVRRAVISGNNVRQVGEAGIRIGVDDQSEGHLGAQNLVISGNTITDVTNNPPSSSSNGIKVMGANNVSIVGNTITRISTSGVSDCEGIYTKARRVVIADNALTDAGQSEGAICCKGNGSEAIITGNVIAQVDTTTLSPGINIQSERATIEGNLLSGITGTGIYMQGSNPNRQRVSIHANTFLDWSGFAIRLLGREGDFHVAGNTFMPNVPDTGGTAVNISPASGATNVQRIFITGNAVHGISSPTNEGRFVTFDVADGRHISNVVIKDNVVNDVGKMLNNSINAGGSVTNVLVEGNVLQNVNIPFHNPSQVTNLVRHANLRDGLGIDGVSIGNGNPASPASGARVYSGAGAPSSTIGANGDFYLRTGTPGTAGQRIYIRSAGSWVATAV